MSSLDCPELILIVVIATRILLDAAQKILVDVGADLTPLAGTRLLIEPEVNPAINARIVHVVSDLRELGVVERHVLNIRVR